MSLCNMEKGLRDLSTDPFLNLETRALALGLLFIGLCILSLRRSQ